MANFKMAASSKVYGKVRIGENSYIAQGTILRSEDDSIRIGNNSAVLENSVVVGTRENPVRVGEKTVFGHKCVVLGAEFGDLCEVGNATVFMPGVKVGDRCIFGEGTIVPANTIIPDNSVVLGRPGRVIRKLTEEDLEMISKMRGDDISLSEYVENIIEGEMEEDSMGELYKFKDKYPQVAESARIFEGAEITGDVIIGENTIIASGVKIIGDSHGPIRIGDNVEILENTVLHLLPDNQLIIGDNVVIGPSSMIHGTEIGENSIIESASIVCDNSKIGKNSLVRSGTLIPQRKEFGDNLIVEGFPAKEVGENPGEVEKPAWSISKKRK